MINFFFVQKINKEKKMHTLKDQWLDQTQLLRFDFRELYIYM